MRASTLCDVAALLDAVASGVLLLAGGGVGDVDAGAGALGDVAPEGDMAVEGIDDGAGAGVVLFDEGGVAWASAVSDGVDGDDAVVPEVAAYTAPAAPKIEATSVVANFRCRAFIEVPFEGTCGTLPLSMRAVHARSLPGTNAMFFRAVAGTR